VSNRNSLPGKPNWVGTVGPFFESGRIKSKLKKAMPGHKGPLWEEKQFRWVGLAVKAPGKWRFVVGDTEWTVGVVKRMPESALSAAKAMASLLEDGDAKRSDVDLQSSVGRDGANRRGSSASDGSRHGRRLLERREGVRSAATSGSSTPSFYLPLSSAFPCSTGAERCARATGAGEERGK
jgi:hypothetical protein